MYNVDKKKKTTRWIEGKCNEQKYWIVVSSCRVKSYQLEEDNFYFKCLTVGSSKWFKNINHKRQIILNRVKIVMWLYINS